MRALLWMLALLALNLGTVGGQESAPPVNLDALPDCNFAADADPALGIDVGAVVVNLETGQGCTQNLDLLYPVASVPKVFVLGAYLEDVMRGQQDYGTRMPFTERYLMGGSSDCLRDEDLGAAVSLGTLSELMIACSDNSATWMLMDRMGWDRVQDYIDSQRILGVGPVIPYSEVDRIKLSYLDPRWDSVPRGLASRYLRRRETDGLTPYFGDDLPAYTREERRAASAQYFADYAYNSATPRAMADYLLKLRAAVDAESGVDGQVARAFFNTLLLTQRQYSTAAFPGTVYVGAKNGFDTGLRAEVSFTLNTLDDFNRTPKSLVILFARQTDWLNAPEVQTPGSTDGPLNELLRGLSPQIVQTLYGAAPESLVPPLSEDPRLGVLRLQSEDAINGCWTDYRLSDYDEDLVGNYAACLESLPERGGYRVGDRVSIGLVMTDLQREDLRLGFVFTAPDGTRISYQTERFFQDQTGLNWFHPLDAAGPWTLDVYVDLRRVASRRVMAN